LTPEQGLRVLGRWLGAAVAQMGVFPVDWALFLASMPSGVPPLLSDLAQTLDAPRGPENRTSKAALLRLLEEAPAEARESLLVDHLRAEVVAILGRDAARGLQPGLGFFEMGMDSLMVLELRRRLQAALGRSVPAPLVFNYPSVESLGRHLAAVLIAPPLAEKQVKARQKDKDAELLAEVAQLSEAEVAAELSALADDLLQDEEESWE
jgi:polyketide synthase 12/myxalamid-type polyketide synthase MxaB